MRCCSPRRCLMSALSIGDLVVLKVGANNLFFSFVPMNNPALLHYCLADIDIPCIHL